MSEASDLRDLARRIDALTREHPAYSMAWPFVSHMTDYLVLRARVLEMTEERADAARKQLSMATDISDSNAD